MITTKILVNIHHLAWLQMSSVVIRTFKIYSLNHFKYTELLLAIVTMLC